MSTLRSYNFSNGIPQPVRIPQGIVYNLLRLIRRRICSCVHLEICCDNYQTVSTLPPAPAVNPVNAFPPPPPPPPGFAPFPPFPPLPAICSAPPPPPAPPIASSVTKTIPFPRSAFQQSADLTGKRARNRISPRHNRCNEGTTTGTRRNRCDAT